MASRGVTWGRHGLIADRSIMSMLLIYLRHMLAVRERMAAMEGVSADLISRIEHL